MFSSQNSQVSNDANYIESCFSTYLYTGNGSTQTITNGIDLSGKGGLVWQKMRSDVASHLLTDTARGSGYALVSNSTGAQFYNSSIVSSFNSNGFTDGGSQASGATYASWTFRKQPKFFDVVTYTGTGSPQNIAHSLGSVPGCIMVKRTDATGSWLVYHQNLLNTSYALLLNSTTGQIGSSTFWNNTAPTSTVFTVGNNTDVNASGGTYVAYIFAHNAGGFGLTGTDNVISCGSALGTATVNLGYEPQWVLVKNVDGGTGNWFISDNMRGLGADDTSNDALLPNLSSAEVDGYGGIKINSTGFSLVLNSTTNYIYIAIRRGPMKVPTDATKVFAPVTYSGDGTNGTRTITTNFPVDSAFSLNRTGATGKASWNRLIGNGQMLITNTSAAQVDQGNTGAAFGSSTGLIVGGRIELNYSGYDYVLEAFRRAPGFFDEVCYAGTGSAQNISHNLGVAPELIITKDRTGVNAWGVGSTALGGWGDDKYLTLNTDRYVNYSGSLNCWNSTAPTSSVFTVGTFPYTNQSGRNYVAYLFATCAGVSKVGSYTGTGSTQTISCGFTGGARFVLIKRIDSTGNWWVWDTARGMTSGNDPELFLNLTIGEDYNENVYTTTGGFQIVSTADGINASGGSYIYLAIA